MAACVRIARRLAALLALASACAARVWHRLTGDEFAACLADDRALDAAAEFSRR